MNREPSAEREVAAACARHDDAAEAIRHAIDCRADSYAFAFLDGKWDEAITDNESLGSIVSEQLCDVPGNEFRCVLEIVRNAARKGDHHACELIERLAYEHAQLAHDKGVLL